MTFVHSPKLWGAAGALLFFTIAGNTAMAAPRQTIESFTLANGLNIIVVPDDRAPVVTHSVWYKVGAVDEKPGKTGLAHMTEHLMFKGTHRHPAGEMDKIVQRKGGQQNAFTSYDFTAYYQKVPVTELPTMMDLESDRMANLTLTDSVFQPERKVVAEERKLRTDSDPTDRFFEEVMRRHYAHHTYGHPVIGWAEDIQNYTHEDALKWYHSHYAPNNATMILVGDVTAKSVKPLIEKYYGPLKPAEVISRTIPVEPATNTSLTYVRIDKQVQVASWNLLYRAPSQFQGIAGAPVIPNQATGLWVLSEILGGGPTSRMYQELVVKQHLADSAHASYDATRAGESTFDLGVQPKEGITADQITPPVQAVIDNLLKNGVTSDEFERARVNLKADEIYARDDPFTTMYRLGMWVNAGGKVADFNNWQEELAHLTIEDVNNLARTYLKSEASTLAVLAGSQKQLGTLKPTSDKE